MAAGWWKQMDEGLLDLLERYEARGIKPMHMPGHKRNGGAARYLDVLNARLDITEIDGFDNLHQPSGILKDAMARAAALWGSENAFFLVNGSTCGILAGVRALAAPGDRVIVARSSHQSVFHALELMELDASYLRPSFDSSLGVFGSVSPEAVEAALSENPGAKLVVVTSPTYEGAVSDIAAILRVTRARGVPLLVDEAHGAHLGFSGRFPGGAVAAGADIVVQSLHKTLPSLTQTAIAHVGGLIDPARFQAQLDIFETSSPSYLLMASIDGCVRLLGAEKDLLFAGWAEKLDAFDRAVNGLKRLTLPGHGAPASPAMHAFDRSKILISTRGTSLTGPALMELLRSKYGIELEMASCDYALAMTGLTEPDSSLEALAAALREIDRDCAPAHGKSEPLEALNLSETDLDCAPASKKPELLEAPALPERVTTISQALRMAREAVPLAEAIGRTAAQYAWAYPPGVPLIAPGERVDAQFLAEAQRYAKAGIPLRGCPADRQLWVAQDSQ
jgi:arginine/lysine/ornithine decarboxylase